MTKVISLILYKTVTVLQVYEMPGDGYKNIIFLNLNLIVKPITGP